MTGPGLTVGEGPLRVVVVDDHAMFRTGVKAEIGKSLDVVGEAEDVESPRLRRRTARMRATTSSRLNGLVT